MNTTLILSGLSAWSWRVLCRWRAARRLRRDMAELATMGAHELRDLGISHASMAAAHHAACCA